MSGWTVNNYGDPTGVVDIVDDPVYGKALRITKSGDGEASGKRVTDVFMTLNYKFK